MAEKLLRSRIARFKPGAHSATDFGFEYIPDGVIAFERGKITLVASYQQLKQQGFDFSACEHLPDSLVMAGFVDAHVHAPQIDVIGAYGKQLLDWLNQYTFPAELKFANESHSYEKNRYFLNQLVANGTTSAMVYTTSFRHSTEQLFELALQKQMRIIAGRVMMDRNAPAGLLDTPERALHECSALIKTWHDTGRLGYAVTPRFSPTSSPEQLAVAGELVKQFPTVWVQTHLSENRDELAWVQQLFPKSQDYLATYEAYGLVNNKALFGHGIYLSDSELQRMAQQGAGIAFCPSSNLFLGSGLFDMQKTKQAGIAVAICSDIGGGTSLSPFKTMGDAYKVCQLQGYSLTAIEAFYLSSYGAAKALQLDKHIGSLEAGYEADIVVINSTAQPFIQQRIKHCQNIEEELFVYITCGDERLISRTYINGELQYQRAENPLG